METSKIVTTLWLIAIPSTILFLLINYTSWNQRRDNSDNKEEIQTLRYLNNIFSFITIYTWASILFMNLTNFIVISLVFAGIISLFIVYLSHNINAKKSSIKRKAQRYYLRNIRISDAEMLRSDNLEYLNQYNTNT